MNRRLRGNIGRALEERPVHRDAKPILASFIAMPCTSTAATKTCEDLPVNSGNSLSVTLPTTLNNYVS